MKDFISFSQVKTSEDAKGVLKYFIYKIEIICSYSFWNWVGPERGELNWTSVKNQAVVTTDCPTDEQIDATLLHLRFFMSDNEDTKIWKLIDFAYPLIEIPDGLKSDLDSAIELFKSWRNAPSGFDAKTNWDFLDIMIFADRAHHNRRAKILIYKDWTRHPAIESVALIDFCRKIREMISHLVHISKCHQAILDTQKDD